MTKHLEWLVDFFNKNSTKIYLVLANVLLVCFAIWFSNAGLLPFKNFGDFAFFVILVLILGIYRPGWTFVFFVGTLVLENINLAPSSVRISLRPYQFFGFITAIALLVQYFSKRLPFALPKFKWIDLIPVIFVVGGLLSTIGATNKGVSFKQTIVAASFVVLYFLSRIFVQSFGDLKRIVPFFLSSGVVIALYGILQNSLFLAGKNSFEVMPGRPNSTFVEADWLGIFLVFFLAALFTLIYKKQKNRLLVVGYWVMVVVSVTTLVLTVSRSAWIGAIIVAVGYLKLVLIWDKSVVSLETKKGSFWEEILAVIFGKWNWKNFYLEFLRLIVVFILGISFVYMFGLTRFQISSRAQSTGGLQKITVSCEKGSVAPEKITSLDELSNFGCRHIDLEEIEQEKSEGKSIQEVFRPDPNVGIRAMIYRASIAQIKENPVFGIGWGNISLILGSDQRGAGLNASNIFLETWLGSGLIGLASLVTLLGYIFITSIVRFVTLKNRSAEMVFVILGLFAIIIPNLFNSGIFLGFVWVFLGISVSLLLAKK